MCVCVYIDAYVCVCVCVCVYTWVSEGMYLRASKERQRKRQLDNLVAIDARADRVDDEFENVWLMRDFIDGQQILVRELERV